MAKTLSIKSSNISVRTRPCTECIHVKRASFLDWKKIIKSATKIMGTTNTVIMSKVQHDNKHFSIIYSDNVILPLSFLICTSLFKCALWVRCQRSPLSVCLYASLLVFRWAEGEICLLSGDITVSGSKLSTSFQLKIRS